MGELINKMLVERLMAVVFSTPWVVKSNSSELDSDSKNRVDYLRNRVNT
jgi:hypothetical protein